LAQKIGKQVDETVPIPETYDELSEWVDTHLTGRLVLHHRALRGIKDGQYEDVRHVYRSLLLLANEYRNMRLGHEGAKDTFDSSITRLNLRCSGSISQHRAGEQGDEYYVRYPIGSDQKRLLELHLRCNANTRDPRRCLAIYFFWDDESSQVVIGWLPGHLNLGGVS
jgi:hypothetical protein